MASGAIPGVKWRAFRRTTLAAVVVAATCAVQYLAPSGRAVASAPASPSAWVPGDASATAQAIQIAPETAGLNYAIVLATSLADFQGNEGQAESETFNGGSIVLTATSDQCNGSAPTVSQSQLPQPAIAESTDGNASQTDNLQDQYASGMGSPGSGGGLGAGEEQASATTQPTATAVTSLADLDIPGAFEISGAQSSATTQQVVGQMREATATDDIAEISLGPGGLVDLDGLHWDVTQETGPTGAVTDSTGDFSIASITVGGVAVPVSSTTLPEALGVVNTALEGTGIEVTLPALSQNAADGEAAMSPMTIGIDDSALGQEVVGSLLGQSETVRDEIDDIVINDISCQTGIPLTVVDILLAALSGGGNLNLDLGGATAVSSGDAYANPFGFDFGASPTSSAGLGSSPTLPAGGGFEASSGASSSTQATAPSKEAAAPSPSRLASSTLHCGTTSPAGHPGCSNGHALLVGLVGLGTIVTMGATDYARLRRFRPFLAEGSSR